MQEIRRNILAGLETNSEEPFYLGLINPILSLSRQIRARENEVGASGLFRKTNFRVDGQPDRIALADVLSTHGRPALPTR
jgi:hypothetical protein